MGAICAETVANVEHSNERAPKYRRRKNTGFSWGIPDSLTHAKVAREKKPAAEAPAVPTIEKSQPESSSGDVVLIHGSTHDLEAYRIAEDYEALCEAFSDRVEDLQATRLGVDAAGRFAGGHASTLLCNPQIKRYGPTSLSRMLKATGMVIVLAIDNERFAQVRERLGRRQRPLRRAAPPAAPTNAQSLDRPRPSGLPLNKPGLEIRDPSTRPIDILGDIASHHLINEDPVVKSAYEKLQSSMTPAQQDILKDQYEYAKKNEGEDRSFEEWKTVAGMPGFFRGYTFQQWPKDFNDKAYTPEQRADLDKLMGYLSKGGKSPDNAASVTTLNGEKVDANYLRNNATLESVGDGRYRVKLGKDPLKPLYAFTGANTEAPEKFVLDLRNRPEGQLPIDVATVQP